MGRGEVDLSLANLFSRFGYEGTASMMGKS